MARILFLLNMVLIASSPAMAVTVASMLEVTNHNVKVSAEDLSKKIRGIKATKSAVVLNARSNVGPLQTGDVLIVGEPHFIQGMPFGETLWTVPLYKKSLEKNNTLILEEAVFCKVERMISSIRYGGFRYDPVCKVISVAAPQN